MSVRAQVSPAFSPAVPLPSVIASNNQTRRPTVSSTPRAVTNVSPPPTSANPRRRRRQVDPPRPDHDAWSSTAAARPPVDLPDLPADLTAHTLLTASEEHDLLLKIRFLQTEQDTHEDLTLEAGANPSDADLAAALSLSPTELHSTRRAALEARNHLVAANLRLVTHIASTVHRGTPTTRRAARNGAPPGAVTCGVSRADLVQEGSIALIRAAERFDLDDARSRFSTYAARAIWTACQRAATPASCIVSLPHRLRMAARKLRILKSRMELAGEDLPGDEELSSLIGEGAPLHLVRMADRYLTSGLSLDDVIFSNEGGGQKQWRRGDYMPADVVEPETFVEWELVRDCLRAAVYRTLSRRDATIIVMRFGLLDDNGPKLVKEIAPMFHVTGARVTQIVTRGLRKIREKEPELARLFECL